MSYAVDLVGFKNLPGLDRCGLANDIYKVFKTLQVGNCVTPNSIFEGEDRPSGDDSGEYPYPKGTGENGLSDQPIKRLTDYFQRRCIFEPEFVLKEARIAIVGLGLMGGSLGMALKEQESCRAVVALVRRREAARQAEALGVVDEATTEPAEALSEADLVIFSTPVRVIIRQLEALAPYYKPGAIITDMGSTKQQIMQTMARLPETVYPIGSHPMCGKEQAGLAVAEADLYQDAPWILTPLSDPAGPALPAVQALAEAVGARPQVLAADRHDKLVAAISHLPYTLAVALVLAAKEAAAEDPAVWQVAASGFRDTSRVAASDVTMMLDILLTNQAAVRRMATRARRRLDQFVQALDDGDEAALRVILEQAAAQRKGLYTH